MSMEQMKISWQEEKRLFKGNKLKQMMQGQVSQQPVMDMGGMEL